MSKVKISPLLVFLIALAVYLGWDREAFCFLVAAALHELGHAAVLLALGRRIRAVKLQICGARIGTDPLSYRQELMCAAAGPMVNLLLFFLFYRRSFLFGLCNLTLSLYNCLPVYPLDGGRILRAALALRYPENAVWRVCHVVSVCVCLMLMVLAVCTVVHFHCGMWPMFLAAVVLWRMGQASAEEGE